MTGILLRGWLVVLARVLRRVLLDEKRVYLAAQFLVAIASTVGVRGR